MLNIQSRRLLFTAGALYFAAITLAESTEDGLAGFADGAMDFASSVNDDIKSDFGGDGTDTETDAGAGVGAGTETGTGTETAASTASGITDGPQPTASTDTSDDDSDDGFDPLGAAHSIGEDVKSDLDLDSRVSDIADIPKSASGLLDSVTSRLSDDSDSSSLSETSSDGAHKFYIPFSGALAGVLLLL